MEYTDISIGQCLSTQLIKFLRNNNQKCGQNSGLIFLILFDWIWVLFSLNET